MVGSTSDHWARPSQWLGPSFGMNRTLGPLHSDPRRLVLSGLLHVGQKPEIVRSSEDVSATPPFETSRATDHDSRPVSVNRLLVVVSLESNVRLSHPSLNWECNSDKSRRLVRPVSVQMDDPPFDALCFRWFSLLKDSSRFLNSGEPLRRYGDFGL